MDDENTRITGAEAGRWLVLGALLAICVVLYFVFAPSVAPVIHPAAIETGP
jgi:hypothetical protein